MPVLSATPDPETRTLTVVADFDAPPSRVWGVWADPRQLERWWGPPTWPATFLEHDLVAGGRSAYVMTGPDGERAAGWWRVLTVDEPRSLELEDGFADAEGRPDEAMPTVRTRVTFEPSATGTRMTIVSSFATAEAMQQLVDMGMVEGLTLALGQIDDLLATGAAQV